MRCRTNRCITGDAILPQTGKKLTEKCDPEFGDLLWRHLTPHRKPQYIGAQLHSLMCIIVTKMFSKIYFLYGFWCMRTNLFIPSRFWNTNFDNAVCAIGIAICGKKNYIGAHLHHRPKTTAVEYSSNLSAIYIKS